MDCNYLGCQVCRTTFKGIPRYKQHVRSREHQKKMEEVFQTDKFKSRGFFPSIVLMDPVAKRDIKLPIVGLSQLTLCFSTETKDFFYLCHVCEEKCSPDRIAWHFSSGDHCSNYLSYTNPNALSFSWIPTMNVRTILKPVLNKEVKEKGSGQLHMLDLPENLLKKLETSTYSEVMHTLSENDKLLKLLKAFQPTRKMIQTYQKDSNRKHPLLGMQHLIECTCLGLAERRYYLCTLCNLTLATHMIIKHVLSFDHIFSYFRAWHPSTLKSRECYLNYSKTFADIILDFAKQTEEIYGTADTDMKQVSLEPHQFTSVNFSCYAEALKELESITKDKNGSSLITSIRPGKTLESCLVDGKNSSWSGVTLCCQDCKISFDTICSYLNHLSKERHKQTLDKLFSKADGAHGYVQKECTPNLGLYRYIKESLRGNQPVYGVSLVVACVCTQDDVEPLYVCFACGECFLQRSLRQHFNSRQHLIHTLMYQNPWRLPFAWNYRPDVKVLKSLAWEEEREQGPNRIQLKVFDMPYWMFWRLTPFYEKVMENLKLHKTFLKSEVPRRQTHIKLKENERFPLLGQQFLVLFHQPTKVEFLCLLCERRLVDDECHAHVFSREHVEKFLNCFHPGSLNSSTDPETLLDLAKQAAAIHSVSHVQVIHLDKPIWEPCSYIKAKNILASAKRREGKGRLEPPIMPKTKLVPRKKDSHENSQMMEGSEKKSSQSSTDNSETTLKKISVQAGAEITKTHCGESGGNAETRADKQTPTSSENRIEKVREVVSKMSSEEIKSVGSETCKVIKEEKEEEPTGETCQAIKEEEIEEPTLRKPSGETVECGQITDKADGSGDERIKDVLTELKNNMYKENARKRTRNMSEKSENTCPNEDAEKDTGHKRQRLTSKQDASCQEPQNPTDEGESDKPSIKTVKHDASSKVNNQQAAHLWQYLKRKSREPVVGLGALLECYCDGRDPIYFCLCCSLKIPEKDIISHVTGADHQEMFLMGSQGLSPPLGKLLEIRHLASVFEQKNGYGEAQAVDLDEDIYNNISKQNFKSAIQTVKALQAQQDSELHPTSALPAVDSMDTSLPDDFQVVDMDIDKDASSQHVSTSGTDTSCLLPDATVNDSKAEIISDTTVGPLKTAATSKIVGASENTAALDSAVTSATKLVTTISKCPAKASSSTSHSTKLTAPISNLRPTTSSCTTTNPTTSILRETAQKCVATTSSATVTATKRTAANPKSTTASRVENATQKSETSSKLTAVSQTLVTSSDTAKMIKSLKCENAEASAKTVHMKNSLGPNADVAPNVPAAPHMTMLMSEHKNPPREPSHTSASKRKPSEDPPIVGRDETIAVTCKDKQQVYCKVCSVRMRRSSHLCSPNHQYNYVKMKYPGWSAKQTEFQSKLYEIVAHLAEAEKGLGSRSQQKIEVNEVEYKMLGDLPDDTAMQRVKEIIRQRSLRVSSSSSTAGSEEVFGQQVAFAGPCEVASPDDGMPQNEMAGLYTDNQSEQEQKHEQQTPMVQISEIDSISKEDGSLAAIRSDRTWSLRSSEPEANNPISPKFHSCPPLNKNKPEPIAAPSSQVAILPVNVQRETFECEVESEAMVEVTPAVEPPVRMEKPYPLTTHSFTQIPNTYQEAAEKRQQQESSDPELQDTHKVLQETQKTSPVKFFNPDRLPSSAAVNTEQQNQSSPIQKVEHVPKHSGCGPEPGQPGASLAQPRISLAVTGERIQKDHSNLSKYFRVMGLDDQPVIGLGSVWECQGISLDTFFLCESCIETITASNICQHMVSHGHRLNCIRKQYLKFSWFMWDEALSQEVKMNIITNLALIFSKRESEMDVQVVRLRDEWYEYVRTAPFSKALKMVQKINTEPTLVFQPLSTVLQKDQQPEDWQSQEQSLPAEKQSTHTLETDQRGDNEARLKTEKHHLETAVVEDLDAIKQKSVLSLLDVTRVSPKVDSVVPVLPGAGTCHSLRETCRSLSMQPELRPLISQHQKPFPDLQVKQAEVHSESPSSSAVVSHKTSQTCSVCSRDVCLPVRKRPASTSPETLVRPGTNNPQIEDPLPAKVHSDSPSSSTVASHKTSQIQSVYPRDICLPVRKRPASTSPETLVRPGTNNPQIEDPLPAKVRSESPSSSAVVNHKTSQTCSVCSRDVCLQVRKRPASTSPETLVRPGTNNPQIEVPLPAKVHSESPSSSAVVSHKTSQICSVCPRDICLPARKSPADNSPETLVRPGTSNPQLEDPLLAKCTHGSPQPISQASTESAAESPPVTPAATFTNKDTGIGSEEQDTPIMDRIHFEGLMDLLRKMKSDPEKAETTASCTENSSESGMERRLDSKYVQTTCQMGKKQTRWDSKWQPIKATVKKVLSCTDSLKDTFSTTAPVVSGPENQLVAPNTSFSAKDSSLGGCSARSNLLSRETEAQAVDNALPSVSTTSKSNPQQQRDVMTHSPGSIPLSQGHTQTNSTEGCHLPINPIITARPDPPNKHFMGNNLGQEQTEVNRGKPVALSSSAVATASPSEVPLVASRGYCPYSQMACVTNGHSGYLYSEAVACYTAADNPPEGFAARSFFPSQIYPEQEANRFGHSLATPPQPEWVRMELQQQQVQQQQVQQQQQQLMWQQQQQQQQLMQQQQQQLIQQQHLSWTTAVLPAGGGRGTNEAAYLNAGPFIAPVNNSQSYIDLNHHRITLIQNSSNIISHNPPQVYLNPLVTHYPPTAQSEIHYLFPLADAFLM